LDSTIDEQISVPWEGKLPDSALEVKNDIISDEYMQKVKEYPDHDEKELSTSCAEAVVVVVVENPLNQLSIDDQYIVVDETMNTVS
jgi:hypothetical protein